MLTYAQSEYDARLPYAVDRLPDFPKVRSLRSGPSWGKVALDARCVLEIRRLVERERPRAILAHHIEAACAALAARASPVYYVAHTDVEHELPVYLPSHAARLARAAARWVEDRVRAGADGVAAVAPGLTTRLGERTTYLPVPWPPGAALATSTRADARLALGVTPNARVCLYAGNLDRYQGWECLVEALAVLRRSEPTARLLIATQSDASDARREARLAGVGDAVDIRALDGEQARARVHAASDLAWIPRRTEGGLPIKMLDAFARGLPALAMQRATAGLDVGTACAVVTNDDAKALAGATGCLLRDRAAAESLAKNARAYLATQHSADTFIQALDRLIGRRPRPVRPRPASPALRAR